MVLAPAAQAGDKVLEFDSMAGVVRPYTGTANAIRRRERGRASWVIRVGKGEVKADGRIEVKVRGLVLADDPAVPPARRLVNPIPSFRAVVSCLTRGRERGRGHRERDDRGLPGDDRRRRRDRGGGRASQPVHRSHRVRHEPGRRLVRRHGWPAG